MNALLLPLLGIVILFLLWKLFFSNDDKTAVSQHYRIVKKKIPVRAHERKKTVKRKRSRRK